MTSAYGRKRTLFSPKLTTLDVRFPPGSGRSGNIAEKVRYRPEADIRRLTKIEFTMSIREQE